MDPPPSVLRLAEALDEILGLLARNERTHLGRARLSSSQAKVLAAISASRETRLTELSRDLGLSKSTISLALEGLERSGLLHRARQPNDRRAYTVRLSERGRALARGMLADRRDLIARAASELTPYQRKTMASTLEALLEALSEPGEEPKG